MPGRIGLPFLVEPCEVMEWRAVRVDDVTEQTLGAEDFLYLQDGIAPVDLYDSVVVLPGHGSVLSKRQSQLTQTSKDSVREVVLQMGGACEVPVGVEFRGRPTDVLDFAELMRMRGVAAGNVARKTHATTGHRKKLMH